MTPEERRAAGQKGGKEAQKRKTAHNWDHDEAVEAGRLGGLKIAKDKRYMAKIGRKGGLQRAINRLRRAIDSNIEQFREQTLKTEG